MLPGLKPPHLETARRIRNGMKADLLTFLKASMPEAFVYYARDSRIMCLTYLAIYMYIRLTLRRRRRDILAAPE